MEVRAIRLSSNVVLNPFKLLFDAGLSAFGSRTCKCWTLGENSDLLALLPSVTPDCVCWWLDLIVISK